MPPAPSIQTPAQMKYSINKAYSLISFVFAQDTSGASITAQDKITTFLAISTPALEDFITLREALYTYKNSVSNQYYSADVDILLNVVKAFVYDYQLGATSSVQIGTLRSVYYCSSLSDTSPTWIATGSSNVVDSIIASKKCNKWSMQAFTNWSNTGTNMIDSSVANVYMSTSSSGGCFEVIGSMWTAATAVPLIQYNSHPTIQLNIPPLQITCASNSCATESVYIASGTRNFIIPSMPVTCTGANIASCSTAPIMLSQATTLTIPSQSTLCLSAPCSFSLINLYDTQGNIFTYPSLTVSCTESTCTIPAAYTSTASNFIYYVPARSVTYDGTSIYNTDPITVTNTYLTIPSYSVTCSTPGGMCSPTSEQVITDSAGNSVDIQSVSISISYGTSITTVQSISMTGSWSGTFTYNIQSQYVECDESSCTVPELVVYNGGNLYYATIPPLSVYSIGSSAASLRGLCDNMLDS